MVIQKSVFLVAVGFGLSSFSQASTIRHDRDAQLYRDLGALYTSVGQVTRDGGSGSGTLIASDWVLSAAHVLSNANTNKEFFIGGNTYQVTNVIQFPGWSLGVNDFALLKLSTPVPGITPALLWDAGGEVGKRGVSVGYGTTGTGLSGNTGGIEKRGFENMIDVKNPSARFPGLLSDFDSPSGGATLFPAIGFNGSSSTALNLEGCAVPGDSGGSLWQTFGGVEYVTGVTSYVVRRNNDPTFGLYGHLSGYSTISSASNWIFNETGIDAVPEPASMIALGLGGLALLRRRKTSNK